MDLRNVNLPKGDLMRGHVGVQAVRNPKPTTWSLLCLKIKTLHHSLSSLLTLIKAHSMPNKPKRSQK